MPFEAKKYTDLVADMREHSADLTDFEVGSVTRTLVESFASELAALYVKMNLAYEAGFIDTAVGIQLDQVVSVLGIKRNLPDYAEGIATFLRDEGGPDILIPQGTLVATEDSEENPKKTYITLEEKWLPATETEIDVKVRAFERGVEQVTPAETIIVMLRPIPGIKAVINSEASRLQGKQRLESDEDLRKRAKNALFASGRATPIAIENALLAAPGIKDARVKEYFHNARGKVKVTRDDTTGELVLPLGHKYEVGDQEIKLLEEVHFEIGQNEDNARVESVTAGIKGEILTYEQVDLNGFSLKIIEPIALDNFGVIHVIIDGVDVENDPDNREQILQLIEQWRAAGIYVILKNVGQVRFEGIFRMEIDPGIKLNAEDRREYERQVEAAILLHLDGLPMGAILKFPKLIQSMLELEGIENLEALHIQTTRLEPDPADPDNAERWQSSTAYFMLSDNRINLGEEERFSINPLTQEEEAPFMLREPGYICVASEEKDLFFDLEFGHINPPGLTLNETHLEEYRSAAQNYLEQSLELYSVTALKNKLGPHIKTDSFRIQAFPWSPRPVIQADNIQISFVEKPVVRKLFVYDSYLNITGALKIRLPDFFTQVDKTKKITQIKTRLDQYLDELLPEEALSLPELVTLAKNISGVLNAEIEVDDFLAYKVNVVDADSGTRDDTRIQPDQKTIELKPFEKARFKHFCITADIAPLEVKLTKLEIEVAGNLPKADLDTIKAALVNTFNNFPVAQGHNISFGNLRALLTASVPGLHFSIKKLTIQATAACDGRTQERDLVHTADIHVRSVELPVLKSINLNDITHKSGSVA